MADLATTDARIFRREIRRANGEIIRFEATIEFLDVSNMFPIRITYSHHPQMKKGGGVWYSDSYSQALNPSEAESMTLYWIGLLQRAYWVV